MLRAHRIVLGVSILLALTFGAAGAQPARVRAAIERGNREFIALFTHGNGQGIAALYSADAEVFPPNSDIVRGKDAIARFWQGAIDSGIKGVTLTTLEVQPHGETAHEVGTYALAGEGGKPIDSGKYVVIWKREQGRWKIHRDIWNTSMPAPAK